MPAALRDALELTPMTGGSSGDDPALKAYEQGAYAISRKALMELLQAGGHARRRDGLCREGAEG